MNGILKWVVLLPPKSCEKLERLVEERDAAFAAMRAADDRATEAALELGRMELDIQRKLAEMRASGKIYENERKSLEKPLASKRAEVDRLRAAHGRAVQRWEDYAFLSDTGDWLREQPKRGLVEQVVLFRHRASPSPKKVTDATTAVAAVRQDLDALDAEWEQVSSAPAPVCDLRARMVEAVERIAARGAPQINATSREGDPVNIGRCLALATHESGTFIGDGGSSFFVWLMRDEIIARVGELIDATPQTGVLTTAERAERFAEIAARRLELERLEEGIISSAAEKGQFIARRREADPRAILEIE